MENKYLSIEDERRRREFIQEIIDRCIYLPVETRKDYMLQITQLNSTYNIQERKLPKN